MKKLSYPPFVVFFDAIAVFLFILILNKNKNTIEIETLGNYIERGIGTVLYEKSNTYIKNKDDKPYEKTNKDVYLLTCGKQYECNKARSKHPHSEIYILINDDLFIEMSQITFLVFREKNCKNINFLIKENGKLDYEMMSNKQKCLLDNNVFKDRINK